MNKNTIQSKNFSDILHDGETAIFPSIANAEAQEEINKVEG